MKREILHQLKLFLCIGLPAWGLAIYLVFFLHRNYLAFLESAFCFFPQAIPGIKFDMLYEKKFPSQKLFEWRKFPHYIPGEDELNKIYFSWLRMLVTFGGVFLILFIKIFPFSAVFASPSVAVYVVLFFVLCFVFIFVLNKL